MSKQRYRAYCIGYEPTRFVPKQALIDELITGSHFCILEPKGVPIGTKLRDLTIAGGVPLRAVAHEHHGKIVILEEESS